MKCIFCRQDSSASKSIEHIIPESLGNKNHILEKGIVCDSCNNYFSTKIEKEVLDLPYFRSLRKRNNILTKKKRLPNEIGFFGDLESGKVEIVGSEGRHLEIVVEKKEIFDRILKGEISNFKIPIYNAPPINNKFLSRFLGKIAIEALAQKVKNVDNWNSEFVNNEGLENLRDYVRYGKGKFWEYKIRKVYEESQLFTNPKVEAEPYQILNEYDFIYLEGGFLIFICVILGIEYSLFLNHHEINIYEEWLIKNNHKNPLETIEDQRFPLVNR